MPFWQPNSGLTGVNRIGSKAAKRRKPMPIQEGWNIVKESLDKIYDSSAGFVYPEPLKSIMPHADERAKRTVFREPDCSLEYRVSDSGASNELAFWQVSLMFVEYVAGMLGDKAGKDCHNAL